MGKREFKVRMTAFYDQIKSSPMWDEAKEMLMPGEREYRAELERRCDGVSLPPDLVSELNNLAAELGMEQRL
jgi:LDH2 family malate/lactate/ureidoglycolate dehydrogenase